MADTPLHEHEAVKHLMGTEHWPKREYREARVRLVYRDDEYPPYWAWQYEIDGNTRPEYHPAFNAEDAITLAAVRGMNATGPKGPRAVWFGPHHKGGYCCEYLIWQPNEEYDERHVLGPTEPLAILAAYQATVMENSNAQ